MSGISRIGDSVEPLFDIMPLPGRASRQHSGTEEEDGGGSQHDQQRRKQAAQAPAPAEPESPENDGGEPPEVDEAIQQLGTDIRAKIFAALGDMGQLYSAMETAAPAQPALGTGRAGDRNKYVYRDGNWFNAATGEPAIPAPEPAPAVTALPPDEVRGTGRLCDLARFTFRNGRWYNLSTGQPGTPDGEAAAESAGPAASPEAAGLFQRLGFEPVIVTLEGAGPCLVGIAGAESPAEPPDGRAPVSVPAGRPARPDAAFRRRYAPWLAASTAGYNRIHLAAAEDFLAAWRALSGPQGFARHDLRAFMHPRTRDIHIRAQATTREPIMHELAHSTRSEVFTAIFSTYRLHGDAGASISEAATAYLAFKTDAPEPFAAAGGYARYLEHKRGPRLTPRDEITRLAEPLFDALGDDLYRAFFAGDPASLARLAAAVRAIPELKIPGTFRTETAPSSAERLADLLHRVAADGRDVSPRSIHRHHRRPDARQNFLPDLEAPLACLARIRDAARGRPQDADMLSQSLHAPGEPLLGAILAGDPLPGYTVFKAADDGFLFSRAGAERERIAQRIYINAAQAHAGDVLDFVIRQIVDRPAAFPGVVGAKISGPFSGAGRTDNIVIYLESEEDRSRVLGHLARYERAHPSHFLPQTPRLAMPHLPGIGIAEEPTAAMKDAAEAIFEAEGLPPPQRHTGRLGFGNLRAIVIYLAYRDCAGAPRPAAGNADFADTLRWKVWQRFVQFGINPDEPSLNLRRGADTAR
ncbi:MULTISPECIES: T3SS effector HopA1 family protein [Rhodomicrobium]|uniref:T3SS effector HopA1 family protein n=1 Tax=Rhodomicrobium TaxID=1068 RepID=UPI000B4AC9E2|nr:MULTISPECIES: T3SS effector HopA1 family protein [Rhodomicrobium]